MCGISTQKVIKVNKLRAVLDNGRNVLLSDINSIHAGDYVKVYADIVIEKVDDIADNKLHENT